MKNFELDHIGVAVESVENALSLYRALGWTEFGIEEVKSEKVRVGFIEMKNQCAIELLEPTSPDSVIRKFLDKRGGGIHHICLRVVGLEQLLVSLKNKGVRLIDDVPRPGAHGCRVAFIHPAAAGGVLIELSEKVDGGKS